MPARQWRTSALSLPSSAIIRLLQVKQYKQLVVGGHQGGMEELKDFVDKKVHFIATHAVITEIYNALQLLEGQERKRLIDLHTQLVQVMFTELKKRNTSDLSFVEEAIISSSSSSSDIKKQVLAILSPPAPSTAAPEKVFLPTDKLRLVPSPSPPSCARYPASLHPPPSPKLPRTQHALTLRLSRQ